MPRAALTFAALIAGPVLGQDVADSTTISRIRDNARAYIQQLSLLTCTEDTKQTVWIPGVTSSETREDGCDTKTYKLFAVQALGLAGTGVNLKRASSDWRDRLREASLGAATEFLSAIAEPNIDVDFRWLGMGTTNGRSVAVVSFRVPTTQGYLLEDTKGTTRVPYKGFIYADPDTGSFTRAEIQCVDIPPDSEYIGANVTVDFKPFNIDGRSVDLPSHSIVRFRMKNGSAANEAVYTGYRLASFSADSEVKFGEEVIQ